MDSIDVGSGSVAQYNVKIQQLFEKFLEPDFQVHNDVYLNRLLTHLKPKESTPEDADAAASSFINLPIFSEWLVQAVSTWDASGLVPATNIASFTINLAALLAKNETKFCSLNNNNFFIKLVNVLRARQPEAPPSVKLGYIKLLSAFLDHKSGLEWMIASNFWEDALKLALTNQTIYITRDGQRFISKILENTIDIDESFCNTIIKRIMQPLGDNALRSLKSTEENMLEISDERVYQCLSPTLKLIGHVLEYFLESSLFAQKDFRIVLIFLKNFHLEQRICNFMMIAQNKYLVFDLGKIMFIMQFLELYVNVVTNSLKMSDVKSCVRKIMSVFNTNITKGNFENVMKFCYFGQLYWNLMGYKIPCMQVNKENETVNFANQLVVLQICPVFCLTMVHCFNCNAPAMEMELNDEFRDAYVSKIFKMMCENTIRIGYNWRDFLILQPNLFEIGTKALMYMMKSRKYYPRQRAAVVFQCFMYTLKDIMDAIKKFPEKLETFAREVHFMSLLLDGIVVFIQEFQITWRDSVETICVMGLAFDFLSLPTWPAKLVVKALKLVNISIAKYMSPNMALLIDRTSDSTMALMGPLLYAKLHDGSWEVRDSAMEVVCTIALLSGSKFPSLRKILMESELPSFVVKMSSCDGESFVRATAIRSLQEMVKVEEIWNCGLVNEDLPNKMKDILVNETEGIVRAEAASLMCFLYEHQQFTEDVLEKMYDTMIYSASIDLHWEVKIRALRFWDLVITNRLLDQGMIDGSFPTVTFSKEHRKIVTLTEQEVRKRLHKVLAQLSSIGCLGVLMAAIRDDCDVEVSKCAVEVTQKFAKLLRMHNIKPTDPQQSGLGGSTSSAPSSPNLEIMSQMSNSPLFLNSNSPSVCSSSGVSSMGTTEYQGSPLGAPSTVSSSSNRNNNLRSTSTTSSTSNCHQMELCCDDIIEQIVNSQDITLLSGVYTPNGDCEDLLLPSPSDSSISSGSSNALKQQQQQQQLKNFDFTREKSKRIVSVDDFLSFVTGQPDLDAIVADKKSWLSGIEDLGSLLDDMLKTYHNDDINSMDCY